MSEEPIRQEFGTYAQEISWGLQFLSLDVGAADWVFRI